MQVVEITKDKKSDRRAQILIAARKVLAEKGLEATKVSDIVKEVGVSQGTFYLYFDSKNSIVKTLMMEMLGSVLEDVKSHLRGEGSFDLEITKGIGAAFYRMSEYRDIFPILNNGSSIAVDPPEWSEMFEAYNEMMEGYITQCQKSGQIHSFFQPSIIARVIISLTADAVEECFTYRSDEISVDVYIENVTRFVINALKV
jgi:AcrR family transcriptional regulator